MPSIENSLNSSVLANPPRVSVSNGGHKTDRKVDKSADGYGSQFPYKLHRLLDDAKCLGFEDVVAWTSDGRAFQIFDKKKLETLILPHYFSSGRFKTFQRSLNLWNFRVEPLRVERRKVLLSSPPATVSSRRRYHHLFRRGCPELCLSMTRIEVKIPGARKIKQSHTAIANAKGCSNYQEKQSIKPTYHSPTTHPDTPKQVSSTFADGSLLPNLSLPVTRSDSPKPLSATLADGTFSPQSSIHVTTSLKKASRVPPLEGVMAMIRNQQSRATSNRMAFVRTTNDPSVFMPATATIPFSPAGSMASCLPPEHSFLGNCLSSLRTSLLHEQVAVQKHQRLVTALRAHHQEMAMMSILQSVRREFSARSFS